MNKQENEIKTMSQDGEENYEALKRLRTNAKRKFTRKQYAFLELSRNNEHALVIRDKFEDIREAYKEIDKLNDRLLTVINKTASHAVMDSLLDECDAYMKDIDSTLDQIRVTYACHMSDSSSKRSEVHVKPLETPRFSGNIREYSSFRQDFNRLMTQNYGKDAYVLRSCLIGSALETVKGVEDNFDEMFYRLDTTYGDPRKFVDVVVQELKSIRPIPDGDSKKFIDMANVIERCWLDLRRMDLSEEMNTVTMVSMVERLLPPTQKREWILKIDSNVKTSKNMFEDLLQYILQEKRVIEYMNHDVRLIGKGRNVNQAIGNTVNDFTNALNDSKEHTEMEAKMRFLEENQLASQRQMLHEIERVTNRLEHIAQVANVSYNQCPAKRMRCLWHPTYKMFLL